MNYKHVALVDFSHMLRVQYHARASDGGPNQAGEQTLAILSDLKRGQDHVIVCLDAPPYKRSTVYPEYKGQRERDDAYIQICKWTKQRLAADGYSIASSPGAEADDVIASLAWRISAMGSEVRIFTSDKDALQCVTDGDDVRGPVHVWAPEKSGKGYEARDEAWVFKRWGVAPAQIPLLLAIMGDDGDNIPGIDGIGEKGAAKLITQFDDIVAMRVAAVKALEDSQLPGGKPLASFWKKFLEGSPRLGEWLALTKLDTELVLDLPALLVKQTPKPLVPESSLDDTDWGDELDEEKKLMAEPDEIISRPKASPAEPATTPAVTASAALIGSGAAPSSTEVEYVTEVGTPIPKASAPGATSQSPPVDASPRTTRAATATNASATEETTSIVVDRPDPPSWALALQPSTAKEAMAIAKVLINSRFVSNYGTPEGVYAVISLGRELGMGMMQALQGFHIVKDRPFASAHTLHALAESDPNCEWLVCTESTDERATWETSHRKAGKLKPFTYTRDEATKAGCYTGGNKHNWQTRERQMLRKTAMANAVRIWYPRAVAGLMIQEESSDD